VDEGALKVAAALGRHGGTHAACGPTGGRPLGLRVVVADCLYGEHHRFTGGLVRRGAPYVVALNPSHAW
jgi:hypothetical protein